MNRMRINSSSAVLAYTAALALTTLVAGCGLIVDPSRHVGVGSGDAALPDGGALDAGPPADVGPPTDSGPVDAAMLDSGPVTPPECTTAADCAGGSIVQCVSNRCVFCAEMPEPVAELRSERGLRDDLVLSIRPRATGPAVVLVGSHGTAGARPLIHRFEIETPSAASAHDLTDGITGGCGAITQVAGFAFGPPEGASTPIGVVARSAMGGLVTNLSWFNLEGEITSAGYTCRSRTAPADVLGGTALVSTTFNVGGMPRVELEQITRERRADGGSQLGVWDFTYAGDRAQRTSSASVAAYAPMDSAGRFAMVAGTSDEQFVMFDPGVSVAAPSVVPTPGRTGWVSGVAVSDGNPGEYLIAYPVGARVRFVTLRCDTRCVPMGESVDLRTDAMSVQHVRFRLVDDVPVVLTAESQPSGEVDLMLRVLRASRVPYDAPGGGRALRLQRLGAGEGVGDIELDALVGATARYAAAWMVHVGSGASVRTQTFVGTCR